MDNFTAIDWLKRAKSNLNRGKECFNLEEREIFIEDLCFDLQQSAEKSLKALLIKFDRGFPKTHDIAKLYYIKDAVFLTPYSVKTRYPNWNIISDEKYKQAVEIAENIYNWAEKIIKE